MEYANELGVYIFGKNEVEEMLEICKDWWNCPHNDPNLHYEDVQKFEQKLEKLLGK